MPRKNLPPPLRTAAEVRDAAAARRAIMVGLRQSGLTFQEIGDAAGIHKNRVRSIVHRGEPKSAPPVRS